jgi:hypothetical protein
MHVLELHIMRISFLVWLRKIKHASQKTSQEDAQKTSKEEAKKSIKESSQEALRSQATGKQASRSEAIRKENDETCAGQGQEKGNAHT